MAISLVSAVVLTPSGSTGGTTAAIDTTGANLLVVSVGHFATLTVSDSKGNAWVGLTAHDASGAVSRLFCCLGAVVGTGHTFTISGSGIFAAATVHAFAGVAAYQTESGTTSASAQPVASGSVTPMTTGALVITSVSSAGTPGTNTLAPAGFTQITSPAQGGISLQVSTGYLMQSPAAAINPTWSWSGSATQIGVSTGVFLATLPASTAPLVAYITRDWGLGGWPGGGGTTGVIDTTGANLLVLGAGWFWNGSLSLTISDSKGNTWIPLTRHSGANAAHQLYYAKNAIVGPGHTFTATQAGVFPSIVVYAFSGTDPIAPFDVENGAGTSSNSGPLTTGSITPSLSGAILVSGLQFGDGSPGAVTVDTALASHLTPLTGSAAAYTVQSPAAAINPSWGYAGGSQGGAVSLAAFKPFVVAASVRVTQALVELLAQNPPPTETRLTQLVTELLTVNPPAFRTRLTQVALEVFEAQPARARTTQVAVEVFTPLIIRARVTQTPVELYDARPARLRVTQEAVEVFLVDRPRRLIRRLRRAPHVHDEHRRITYARFALDLQRGVGALMGQGANPVVTLRVSRDGGRTWGEPVRMRAGTLGAFTTRVLARRLGHARDAVFEVTVSDPVAWSLVQAWLDLEPGTS